MRTFYQILRLEVRYEEGTFGGEGGRGIRGGACFEDWGWLGNG
jgi:hypothetical protein